MREQLRNIIYYCDMIIQSKKRIKDQIVHESQCLLDTKNTQQYLIQENKGKTY